MKELAWPYRGPLAGRFIFMEPDDLDKAVEDDWAQKVAGAGDDKVVASSAFKQVVTGPHKAAEDYAEGTMGYSNRQLVSGDSPSPLPSQEVKPKRKK